MSCPQHNTNTTATFRILERERETEMVGGGGGGGALRRVGKYEVGRTIGEGTFAKVKFAQNTETGESVAMKVLDRSSILKRKMADQVSVDLIL